MPLPESIAENRTAIARIVAGLFALLGLTRGPAAARIPRELHRAILRVLRPAESAVRRLILIVSKSIKPQALAASVLMPQGVIVRTGQSEPAVPCFQLFDPRQRWLRPHRAPNIARPQPRISFFGDGEVRTISWGRPPPAKKDEADNLRPSAHLARRLQALKAALDDLPRQARRLARALARRQKLPRLMAKGVLRPGRAPGLPRRPVADIHHLLDNCDWLARQTLAPDTS